MLPPSDDAQLLTLLNKVSGSALDPKVRARIASLERTGAHVTVFEIRENGALLMIVHQGDVPSTAAIRAAYNRHLESAENLS
jgi:hypothetical protein